jgi:hypothetical protein
MASWEVEGKLSRPRGGHTLLAAARAALRLIRRMNMVVGGGR